MKLHPLQYFNGWTVCHYSHRAHRLEILGSGERWTDLEGTAEMIGPYVLRRRARQR